MSGVSSSGTGDLLPESNAKKVNAKILEYLLLLKSDPLPLRIRFSERMPLKSKTSTASTFQKWTNPHSCGSGPISLSFCISHKLTVLRSIPNGRKSCTTPAAIDTLQVIQTDKKLLTGKYGRHCSFTKEQKEICKASGAEESAIDEIIEKLVETAYILCRGRALQMINEESPKKSEECHCFERIRHENIVLMKSFHQRKRTSRNGNMSGHFNKNERRRFWFSSFVAGRERKGHFLGES